MGFPLTVRDDLGRAVTFPGPPRRIVSLAPSHTETLYALGLEERVVAVDRYSDYPPRVREKRRLNTWPRPPMEAIVALKPDLVLVLTEGEEALREMEAVGLHALHLGPRDFQDVLDDILLLSRVAGVEAAGRRLTEQMAGQVRRLRQQLAGAAPVPVIYVVDGTDPGRPYVVGGGDFMGDVLRIAGGRNVFADIRRPAGQVSLEQVVALKPALILTGSQATARDLLRHPGWRLVPAVRQRRVHAIDAHTFTRPGPRLTEAMLTIAHLLHPDLVREAEH